MNENVTDRVRARLLDVWVKATWIGFIVWILQIVGSSEPARMAGFLAIYLPMTGALLGGEAANIMKRYSANPEVMAAEVDLIRARNGEHDGRDEDH